MTDESSAIGKPYEIVLIRRAKPPPGGKGSNGYRYVIAFEGTNIIHGCRQGNLKAVTREVEETVARFERTAQDDEGEVENPQVTIDHQID